MEPVHPVCLEPPKTSAATKPALLAFLGSIKTNTRPRTVKPASPTPLQQKAYIAARVTPVSKISMEVITIPMACFVKHAPSTLLKVTMEMKVAHNAHHFVPVVVNLAHISVLLQNAPAYKI